jgi:hypothetical protein
MLILMRHLILIAVIVSAIFSSRSSMADSARAKEKVAKKACAAGDFRKGVEILAGLYVNTDDTVYVFNQGRCYEQNHQWASAIDRFREYLRKSPNASASEKAEAEKHIADCEAFREKEEPMQVPAPVPPAPVPAPVATPAPAPVNVVVAQPTAPKSRDGAGLRLSGVVVGAAGAATALIGLALNLKANSLANDYNRTKDPATKSSNSSYKTGSMICYGSGAGLLATGVVLYLVGRSGGGEGASQVSFLPSLTPTGFSLTARSHKDKRPGEPGHPGVGDAVFRLLHRTSARQPDRRPSRLRSRWRGPADQAGRCGTESRWRDRWPGRCAGRL